ncbi:MAG: hypothetical protein K0R98_175 [Rickettsiaceae bacterium]|jgi:tetratricopeptide (TPR) repeat protein|nr:hypothetical protein [Rickettsiaceae bacterium]
MRETNNDVTRKQEAHEWFNKGFAAEKMEDQISCYTKAINLYPEGTTTDLALAYNNRSAAYHNSGKYIEAIADCTKAINLYPEGTTTDLAIAYTSRGREYLALSKEAEAIIDCTKAINLFPVGTTTQLAKAYHIRAFAHYLLKNNPSQALADYNEEVKLGGAPIITESEKEELIKDEEKQRKEHDKEINEFKERQRATREERGIKNGIKPVLGRGKLIGIESDFAKEEKKEEGFFASLFGGKKEKTLEEEWVERVTEKRVSNSTSSSKGSLGYEKI